MFEELFVFILLLFKCLWIFVEKFWEMVGLEKFFFDIEVNNEVVEGLFIYIFVEFKIIYLMEI